MMMTLYIIALRSEMRSGKYEFNYEVVKNRPIYHRIVS